MNPAVEGMVRDCRRCYLGDLHNGPMPWEGKVGATFLVLGAAPSRSEDESGWIWTGKVGRTMRQILVEAGIPNSDVAWGHVVSCRVPTKSRTRDGTPKEADVLACGSIRTVQLNVLQPKVVLLVGATAMKAFRPDWEFKDMVGWPFYLDKRLFVTTHHPAAMKPSQPDIEAHIRQVVKWARMRGRLDENGRLNTDDWPDRCHIKGCGREVERYDEMGVPYCEAHVGLMGKEKVPGVQMRMVG